MLRKLSMCFMTGIYIETALTAENRIQSCNLQMHPHTHPTIFRDKTPDMNTSEQGGGFLLLLRLMVAPALTEDGISTKLTF